MSFDEIINRLKMMDNEHVLEFIGQMEIDRYIHNPWFLAAMGALAILCLIFKWRLLLSTIVGVTGLAWLVSYTAQQAAGESIKLGSQNMLVFVGGGTAVIALMIYILFIKGE